MKTYAILAVVSISLLNLYPIQAQETVKSTVETREDVSLTIYNGGIAMVRDHRQISLPKGLVRMEFEDVAGLIQPDTSIFEGRGLSVIEQNFDYDLLSPQKLFEKAVGRDVTLVRTNPATGVELRETARVLSVNGGTVLQIGDRIEILREDSLPTRVVFDRVPENLRSRPTLSMLLDSKRSGNRDIDLTYLTDGLIWSANYVLDFDEKAGELDLTGWITLTNNSGVSFKDAKTYVIAGDVNVVRGNIPRKRAATLRADAGEVIVTGSRVTREEIFDYHLYELPQPTTIADRQEKQLTFLTAEDVKATRYYRYDAVGFGSFETPENADVKLEFKNDKENNLGAPLPKGVMRVYGEDKSGKKHFLGSDANRAIPEGRNVDLYLGRAFDITLTAQQKDFKVIARSNKGNTVEFLQNYAFQNARAEDVILRFYQAKYTGEWEILDQTQDHQRIDANTVRWDVAIPAKGEAVLEFKVRQRN